MFKLRFPPSQIRRWAAKYEYARSDRPLFSIGDMARAQGELTRQQFLEVARWKTPRSASRCARNEDSFVRQVTGAALRSADPRFKIEVLTILDGVDWPTASVILHFCDNERWPILDYRAFWSLNQPAPAGKYHFSMWREYSDVTRTIADRAAVDMRTLDKALWAYSKLHQR